MKILITVILSMVLIRTTAQPQFPVYLVDLIKGNVTVVRNNTAPVPLKYRDLVYRADKVIIHEGAQLTLVNQKYKTIQVIEKGTYSTAELDKLLPSSGTGILRLYFSMVWEEVLPGKKNVTGIRKLTKSLGSVRRGNCDVSFFPPDNAITAADTVVLEWNKIGRATKFSYRLLDSENKVVREGVIPDTQIVITRTMMGPVTGREFYWEVKPLNTDCKEDIKSTIQWLSKDRYAEELERIIAAVGKNDHSPRYLLKVAEALALKNYFEKAAEYILMAVAAGGVEQ